jgi:stage II sporulation protein P
VEIDGKKSAQVMIISGCDDGTMDMPDYMQNFRFASLLQQQMASDYENLARPVLFDYRKYNQDLTTGSLLIEVGTHGNTLEQVQYAGELVGKSLSKALKSITE